MRQVFSRTADTQFTPGRGARAAVAMLLPVVVLEVLGRNRANGDAAAGTLLGVLFVAFCDIGTSPPIRARAMAAGAVVGALLLALGSSIGGSWWVAVLAVALATLLSGMLPVYGPVVAQVGIILTIVFALALGRDGGPIRAGPTALGFLFGGAFFLLLVLVSVVLRRSPPPVGQTPTVAQTPPLAVPRGRVSFRSPMLHFALLRAGGAALVAGLAWGSGIAYPHWAPIVVIASVRPDQMAALRLTTQRVVGTVLGAGLADVVLFSVQVPVVVAGLAILGVFLAFTVKDVNYTFFVFFLTTQTLLLLSLPAPGPTHAALRVVTTLIGAVVALGISWLSARFVRRTAAPPHAPPEPSPGSAAA
jgi:hypothetical protein